MFTPLPPRSLFIACLFVFGAMVANPGIAQFVKLHPLPEYEASLKVFHTQKVRTQCVEFEQKTKMKWWYYLPTIGIQFGFPSVTAGTNQLVQIDQTKQQNRAKLSAIISQATLDYQGELHALRTLHAEVTLERALAYEFQAVYDMENQVFGMTKEAYQKQEIGPKEYYEARLNLQRSGFATNAKWLTYNIRTIEVGRFARYDFPFEQVLPVPAAPGSDPKGSVVSPDQQEN